MLILTIFGSEGHESDFEMGLHYEINKKQKRNRKHHTHKTAVPHIHIHPHNPQQEVQRVPYCLLDAE